MQTIKQTKFLLLLWTCIMLLLAGCTEKNRNTIQSDTTIEKVKENIPSTLPPTQSDTGQSIEHQSESVTLPGFDYDPQLGSDLSLQDGFYIADYGKTVGENNTYEVFHIRKDDERKEPVSQYWAIIVLQDSQVITVLTVEDGEQGVGVPSALEMIIESDVNFDGRPDLLIGLGHFGNQGAVYYKCYLSTDAGLTLCPSFGGIMNPAIDDENQVVRSQWRNSSTSHSWGIFQFEQGAFIETKRLTERAVGTDQAGMLIWGWTEEVFSDGEWRTQDSFTQEDLDRETIDARFRGPDSDWGIDQPKWRILYWE